MFKKGIHHKTIRNQILIITFAFSIFIGAVISVSSYCTYHRYLKRSMIRTIDTNLLFLTDYLDNQLNNIDELIFYCQNNSTIASFVESRNLSSSSKRIAAYQTLSEYCQHSASADYLHRVVITNLSESYIQIVAPSYSSTTNIARTLPQQGFYEELLSSGYQDYTIGFLTDVFYSGHEKTVTPLLKPITCQFNSNLGGYIFIEVSDTLFADAFKNTYYEDGCDLFLTLGGHTYLYTDGVFTETASNYELLKSEESVSVRGSSQTDYIRTDDGTEYIVVTEPLRHSGCYVSQLVSPRQLQPGVIALFSLSALIFCVLLLISVLLNRLLNRAINIPVSQIQKRLVRIADGDFSRDTSIEWDHELGDIGKGVNDLAENIDRLIQTTLSDEKQKRDLEYKVLQSQINPHFLYNTLNSIKWMATIQGADGITEMTTALSRLLKSISKGTKLIIPLREELSLIQDYFTIQQYRYGGTIQMNIQVDEPALYDCAIIKFTLQPLVENAIFHGIEPTEASGEIHIHVYAVPEQNVRIDITDNGVGMSPETIQKILHDNAINTSDFFKEIGISNVHRRLQYEFGDSYGISIESRPGEYTTMSILIPWNTL